MSDAGIAPLPQLSWVRYERIPIVVDLDERDRERANLAVAYYNILRRYMEVAFGGDHIHILEELAWFYVSLRRDMRDLISQSPHLSSLSEGFDAAFPVGLNVIVVDYLDAEDRWEHVILPTMAAYHDRILTFCAETGISPFHPVITDDEAANALSHYEDIAVFSEMLKRGQESDPPTTHRSPSLKSASSVNSVNEPWRSIPEATDQRIVKMWHRGDTVAQIAAELGRVPKTVRNRLSQLRSAHGEVVIPYSPNRKK